MNVFSGYGMTETACAATYHENEIEATRPGKPLPGTEVRVLYQDEMGVGELCYKGRNVFMGYFKDEEATSKVFDGKGFFHSGKRGFI
eukprot:CAMPEP_0202964142 /NCGR_PEP_ID=MMETSP1396-20130829/8217_1 /ASSEMBLY_ACC=CAM_ASM_000872 /TAXON_ID= /ORGANISM="Pseudokeronopsis sp., Strain Brazil" /LENGTH=86 /DNA_ID=CAMNT_0049686013 /DNA_START=1501 /DNA_END=1758 /DNA_ORIENTATION=+